MVRFAFLLFLLLPAVAFGISASEQRSLVPLPAAVAEEDNGCGDGSNKVLAEKACKRYLDMEKTFGANGWTTAEGGRCIQYFEVVARIRSAVCSYKRDYDAIPGNFQGAVQTDGAIERLRAYAGALDQAKNVHQKYLAILEKILPFHQIRYEEYRRTLRDISGETGRRPLWEDLALAEAYCRGGSVGGIQQTSFRVRAENQLHKAWVEKIYPQVEQAIRHDIQWAKDWVQVAGFPSETQRQRLGELRSVEPSAPAAPAVPASPERHGLHGSSIPVTTLREGGIAGAAEYAHTLGAKSAPYVGALVSLGYELFSEGHISPQGVIAAGVGIVNAPTGVVLSVFFAQVANQQNRIAYFRSFATHEARNNVKNNVDVKGAEISKEFCDHLEQKEKEATELTRQRIEQEAATTRAAVEQQQEMSRDMRTVFDAQGTENRQRAYQAYCQKWAARVQGFQCPNQ